MFFWSKQANDHNTQLSAKVQNTGCCCRTQKHTGLRIHFIDGEQADCTTQLIFMTRQKHQCHQRSEKSDHSGDHSTHSYNKSRTGTFIFSCFLCIFISIWIICIHRNYHVILVIVKWIPGFQQGSRIFRYQSQITFHTDGISGNK